MLDFYWYPRCSTCKKAKYWLDEHNIDYSLKDIVEHTPSEEQVLSWLEMFPEIPKKRWFNTSGLIYRELKLKEKVDALTNEQMARLLSSNGKLIRRPLLVQKNEFILNGFKEEQYKEKLR